MGKLFDASDIEDRLQNIKCIEDLTGKNGILAAIVKTTVDRLLKAELDAHLGYPANDKAPKETANRRNGYSKKELKTSTGSVELEIPRDRQGEFSPKFIEKNKNFDPDLEAKIVSMYAKGISTRDMSSHLGDLYGTEVSPTLISAITNRVMDDVVEWQQRPLEKVYPIVFFDAFFYKTRIDSRVVTKACYSCLAINAEGMNELLGLWTAESEGAHFWLSVLTELKSRGVEDILIACVDGLKGFPEAIQSEFPKTTTQQCIVHQIRQSLRYIGSYDQKDFIKDLRSIYQAPSRETAEENLRGLETKWSGKYQAATDSWIRNWPTLSSFFDFPAPIRKIIYTTNIVEGFHRRVRKITKTKGAFPSDQAFKKLVYLVIRDIESKDRARKQGWGQMLSQLKIIFGDRLSIEGLR